MARRREQVGTRGRSWLRRARHGATPGSSAPAPALEEPGEAADVPASGTVAVGDVEGTETPLDHVLRSAETARAGQPRAER